VRNCWLRFKSHDWEATGSFSFRRGGLVIRCVECGRMITTRNRFLIMEALERSKQLEEEAKRNPHALHLDDPAHYDERGRYMWWGD